MELGALIVIAAFGSCAAAFVTGAATAFGASHAGKKLVGLLLMILAAAFGAVLLSGSEALALILLASGAATTVLGAAILARLAEAYGEAEADAFGSVDEADESGEA
ncbi:MAG: hypothetical protein AB7O04_05410 [Hyphomonadaceae bacterium]